MALIVEDGTTVANANTYVSDSDYTTYATARGKSVGADATTREQELIQAMDYIEALSFKGTKNTKAQALQWPRSDVYVDGFEVEDDEIPQLLKDGQMEVAILIAGGTNPLGIIDRATSREKLDTLEVEYQESANPTVIARTINAKLKKLINSASGRLVRI